MLRLRSDKAVRTIAFALFIGFLFFASAHATSIVYFYHSWRLAHEDQLLKLVPEPLPTLNLSANTDRDFSYFGVKFKTPWDDLDSVKELSSATRIQFKNGSFVLLFDPRRAVDRVAISEDVATKEKRDIRQVYGSEAMESNYSFVRSAFYLTPGQISIFSGTKRLVRDGTFLQFKHMEMNGAETGIFCFSLGALRGFQKGDPAKAPLVVIDAFDSNDREYVIYIGATKGTNAVVRQEDINAILSSVKPLPKIEAAPAIGHIGTPG